jgi:hypothetical protein
MKLPISELKTAAPFRELFPVNPKLVSAIAANMAKHGYAEEHPVVIWKGRRSTIIDGHTRVAAATQAGIVDVPVVAVDFADETAALEYAIASQRNRRNLTDAEMHRCIQELGKRQRGRVAANPSSEGIETAPPTAAEIAEKLGMSTSKVEKSRIVDTHAPAEVKAAVQSGDMTINSAYRATQLSRKASEPKEVVVASRDVAGEFDQAVRRLLTAEDRSCW